MSFLEKEDYIEPRCPLCAPDAMQRVPIMRILEKLDDFLGQNDYGNAKRHLKYWLAEAEASNDMEGALSITNELIGLCRKLGEGTESLAYSEKAIKLAKSLGFEDSVTMATTLLNAGTANNAFGHEEKAVELYEKAQILYEKYLDEKDTRLAGLYNNMALSYLNVKNYDPAEKYFNKALEVLSKTEGNEPEEAITYCNLADLKAAVLGLEDANPYITDYLTKAMNLLDKEQRHDGNYAYVCEKCAPVFGYYGYFMYQEELEERSRKIYEGA